VIIKNQLNKLNAADAYTFMQQNGPPHDVILSVCNKFMKSLLEKGGGGMHRIRKYIETKVNFTTTIFSDSFNSFDAIRIHFLSGFASAEREIRVVTWRSVYGVSILVVFNKMRNEKSFACRKVMMTVFLCFYNYHKNSLEGSEGRGFDQLSCM
jgi:hypothetical protein